MCLHTETDKTTADAEKEEMCVFIGWFKCVCVNVCVCEPERETQLKRGCKVHTCTHTQIHQASE